MDLGKKFDDISKKMRNDFDDIRNVMQHPGEKGRSFEEVVREFLKKYFPKTLDISTGFLIDSNGNESNRMDIIISDAAKTPIFYESTSLRVLPVECVYAVIEVKTLLDSITLQQTYKNMISVRRLEKKAYVKEPPFDQFSVNQYGRIWPVWPINYYVFAINSINLNNIASQMENKYSEENLPIYSRIDSACVLDKGVICNKYLDGQIDALPAPNSQLLCVFTALALLLFYALISSHLFKAQLPFFQLHDYLRRVSF